MALPLRLHRAQPAVVSDCLGVVGGDGPLCLLVYSPATVYRYLKGERQPGHSIGTTPGGCFSPGLLAFLLLQ